MRLLTDELISCENVAGVITSSAAVAAGVTASASAAVAVEVAAAGVAEEVRIGGGGGAAKPAGAINPALDLGGLMVTTSVLAPPTSGKTLVIL